MPTKTQSTVSAPACATLVSAPTPSASGPAGPALLILQFMLTACTQMSAKAKEFFGAVGAPNTKVLWAAHIPMAAEVGADMIDLAPALFGWFARSPLWIRATVVEIKLLTEIGSYLDASSTLFSNLLQRRRVELATAVAALKTGIDGILASQLTPPDVLTRLTEISQPLTDLLARQNAAMNAKKKATRQKSQQVQGLTEQVQKLGATPVSAPKRGRKARRQG